MATITRSCDNCGVTFQNSKHDVIKFTAKVCGTDLIVGDVVKEMMFRQNPKAPFTPIRNCYNEERAFCLSCVYKLRALHKLFHDFFPPPETKSYVRRKMDMILDDVTSDVEPGPAPSPNPTPSPAEKTLKQKEKDIKHAHIIRLRKEIQAFAANSKHLHGNLGSKDDNPNWDAVDEELRQLAPNLRKVFLGIGGNNSNETMNPKFGSMTPKVGTALAILVNANNKFANRFQCCLSFVLARTRASKQVYQSNYL